MARHWREVLSDDLKVHFSSGSPKKPGKSAMAGDQRQAIWSAICKMADKADWKSLEQETGVGATKLKRQLKGSMRNEGEKFIGS